MKIHAGPRYSTDPDELLEQVITELKPLIQRNITRAYAAGQHPEVKQGRKVRVGVDKGKKIAPVGQGDSIEFIENPLVDIANSTMLMELDEMTRGDEPEEIKPEE